MSSVIISGGSGTRLWPVSRKSFPKQFCELLDESLIIKTAKRLKGLGPISVLTVESMKVLTQKTASECGINKNSLIFEPYGRNTAAAIALYLKICCFQNKTDEVVGFFPADHIMGNENRFIGACEFAKRIVFETDQVVTLGIEPSYPSTGYGYIEITNEDVYKDSQFTAYVSPGFHEKPNISDAKRFVEGKRHFWNAGIFFFKVDFMINLFKEHMPVLWSEFEKLDSDLSNIKDVYDNIEAISFDFAIMEKLESHICIPCDPEWNDVGSWDELMKIKAQSKTDFKSKSYNINSENVNLLSYGSKITAFIDVKDLIVVDTEDALLVSKVGSSQKVNQIVSQIMEGGFVQAEEHLFEFRPWGKYHSLYEDNDFKVKKIQVEPGQRLSYQSHIKRSEHWVLICGRALVTLDEEDIVLEAGSSICIPSGSKHRIKNISEELLIFVEVQVGDYFGEDDIIRYQDDYDRTNS